MNDHDTLIFEGDDWNILKTFSVYGTDYTGFIILKGCEKKMVWANEHHQFEPTTLQVQVQIQRYKSAINNLS